jgi:GNAT superfamily N-acetyltransferase
MKPDRPSGTLQALGAATALAIRPQRALEAVRQFKAARERRSDARSGVQLRQAGAGDLAALAALHRACGLAGAPHPEGGAGPMEAAWAVLVDAGAQVWLAERDGALLGALTLYVLPLLAHGGSRAGWVDDLVVHPGAHHLSIPRRLIAQATEVAIAAGAQKLALAPRRKPARGFVENLEYSRHGRSADLPPAAEGLA